MDSLRFTKWINMDSILETSTVSLALACFRWQTSHSLHPGRPVVLELSFEAKIPQPDRPAPALLSMVDSRPQSLDFRLHHLVILQKPGSHLLSASQGSFRSRKEPALGAGVQLTRKCSSSLLKPPSFIRPPYFRMRVNKYLKQTSTSHSKFGK